MHAFKYESSGLGAALEANFGGFYSLGLRAAPIKRCTRVFNVASKPKRVKLKCDS